MGFYATKGMGINQVRLSYCLNCNDLKRALELLAEVINKYNKRTGKIIPSF